MIQGSADLITDVLYAIGGLIRNTIINLGEGLTAVTGSLSGGGDATTGE